MTPKVLGISASPQKGGKVDTLVQEVLSATRLPHELVRLHALEIRPCKACNGCRACMRACQFGAIHYSAACKKALIQPRSCYGCGTCRVHCAKKAITLHDRASVPAAANLW